MKINQTWSGPVSLIGLAAVVIIAGCCMTSCANIQSIPFSVSYEDDNGETFTVTTEIPIHRIHADK
jgi:uncharacterized protein (UPF0248 family)